MKLLFNTILFLLACFIVYAQEGIEFTKPIETKISVTEKNIFYKLADNTISIRIQQYGERTDIVFINLHDDEITSGWHTDRIGEQDSKKYSFSFRPIYLYS